MSYLAEIRKLTGNQTVFLLVFIGALVAPGVLIIWRFAPHIIEKGELGILLLLASSIGLSITIVNLMAITWIADVDNFDNTARAMNQLGVAASMTVITTSLFLFLDLISGWNLSLKGYANSIFVFDFLLFGSAKVDRVFKARRNK